MSENFDFIGGAWDTLSDMLQNFSSFEGALAVCAGVGLFMFLILGIYGKNLSVWSVVGGLVAGFALFAIISNMTGLYDWLKLGFEFTNVSASIFAVGVVWAAIVAVYNLLATGGKTAVR